MQSFVHGNEYVPITEITRAKMLLYTPYSECGALASAKREGVVWEGGEGLAEHLPSSVGQFLHSARKELEHYHQCTPFPPFLHLTQRTYKHNLALRATYTGLIYLL